MTLELRHVARAPFRVAVADGVADGHVLDVGACLKMAVLLDGVLDPRRANPINVRPMLSCPPNQGDPSARSPAF